MNSITRRLLIRAIDPHVPRLSLPALDFEISFSILVTVIGERVWKSVVGYRGASA
jgi:hypothetical protein